MLNFNQFNSVFVQWLCCRVFAVVFLGVFFWGGCFLGEEVCHVCCFLFVFLFVVFFVVLVFLGGLTHQHNGSKYFSYI